MHRRALGFVTAVAVILVASVSRADEAVAADAPTAVQEAPAITLRTADEPILQVGRMDGPEEYQFHDIDSAIRTRDGGIIVGVAGSFEIRRYGPDGVHLWTSGRQGDGPGEFRSIRLMRGCTTEDTVFVFDRRHRRVTVFDGDGQLVRTFPLALPSYEVPRNVRCAPGGRFVMSDWGNDADYEARFVAGHHRMTHSLVFQDEDSRAELLRENILGEDRTTYVKEGLEPIQGPRRWGRQLVFAPANRGVWMATGDAYEIEFVEWNGTVSRRARWNGSDLSVTGADLDAYRDALRNMYSEGGEPGWRAEFEDRWRREIPDFPSVFPSVATVLATPSGGVWAERYMRPTDRHREWNLFEADGVWIARLHLGRRQHVLDAGADWVLVRSADSLGVQRLAVYELVEVDESGERAPG